MAVWRLNTNGTLDTSFAGSGFMTDHNTGGGNSNDLAFGLALGSNDEIYTVGESVSSGGTARDMTIWKIFP